jgi:AcrR family transcriptional regulator
MMSSRISETRTRILAAALHLLETGQGTGVRMTDIARRAKLSRQAVYLHFPTRAQLLIATTHYLDELKDTEQRLVPRRTATRGIERLDAFIEAWSAYIPEIYGIAKALLAMSDTDEAAANAWRARMQDVREGCEAAINALHRDNRLAPGQSCDEATDVLWTMLSVRNWEQLTIECGWSQEKYVQTLKAMAQQLFVVQRYRPAAAQKLLSRVKRPR